MFDFRVVLTVPFLFIAVLINLIAFKTFIFTSISILCASVLFEIWSSSGWIRADNRQQKKRKSGEKERLSVPNGAFKTMFFNRSFQDKSKGNKTTRSPWKFGSNSPPPDNRVRNRNAVSRNHSFAGRRSDFNNSRITDSRLTSIPFLPTVRKALGLDNVSRSPLTKTPEVAAAYPERPMAGFLPAVRLGRRERPQFSPSSRTIGRSPNTVKIAPPDSRRINNSRLFQVKNENARTTPNTQAVLSALKEKSRKRTMDGLDVTISDVQGQMAKRRRQESQQSNASTSSLPSLPDNLPDLSTQGYTIPRLKTPTLKRTLNMTNLSEADWEDSERENSQKRPRREAQYNSIASSLSSMRRIKERQAVMKRKNESKENSSLVEDRSGQNSPVTKKPSLQSVDTVLLPENKDIPVTKAQKTEDASKSQLSDLETSVAEFLGQSGTHKSVRTPKRVALSEKVSARKREMSLYAGLNKTYENVPQANVIAKIEDYDKDREEEEKRVQEMMAEIGEPEKEVTATETTSSSTVSTTAPVISATVSPLANITTPVTLGSTRPLSEAISNALPISNTTASYIAAPSLFSVNTTTSSNSVSPANKTLTSAAISFGGSPSVGSDVNKSSSMASLSSSTTTVTSASGAISSAAPFSLPITASSATKTTSVPGFQFGQSLTTTAISSSTTPAPTTISGILSSGTNSRTTASTSALPAVFGGQTSTLVSSSSGPGGFNFGGQVSAATSSASALPTISTLGGFKLGTQSSSASQAVTATTASSVGGFSFGGQSSSAISPVSSVTVTTTKSTVGGFNCGGTTTTTSSLLPNGFNFGSQTTSVSTMTTSGGVSFNSPAATTAATASAPGGFNFTATPATQGNPVGVFNFGAGKMTTAASSTSSTFAFGGNSSAPSVGVISGALTTSAPGGFNFGTVTAPSASAPTATGGFNFGTQNQAPAPPTTTTAAGVFSFGGQNVSSTTSSTSGGFNFGGASNSTAGTFNFGKSNPSTTVPLGAFGATITSKSELPKPAFTFGTDTGNPSISSSSAFGQQPAGPQSGSTFSFGQTTTAASSVFGQPAAPQSSSVFGQFQSTGQTSQSQTPAFGSNTTVSTFGQASNTQAVFGQPAGSQTTTGFGQTLQGTSGFGQSASSSGFGQPSAQSSFNFGQQNPNTQSGSAFGQQTAPQPSFAFGQTPSAQQTTFGQQQPSFGQQPGSVFGQSQNPPAFGQSTGAPAFTKSASSPNFGTSSVNGGGTGFNFGMATPMKNSLNSAGSTAFNFGTPQNNSATPNQSTPANPSKGFDFSQSLAPGASFNFGAGGGNTSFGTPSGGNIPQPNFGTPTFSVGSGNTGNQAKPRPIRKPIRRTRR